MGEAKGRKTLGQYPERSKLNADPFISHSWRLRFITHPKAVVTVETSQGIYQICHLMFAKDGSIFVQFPYFKHTTGLVSKISFEPTLISPTRFDLKDGGKVSSHLVKYSHHPDGRVHFSQDGKVRTEIQRTSFRLDGPIGRIFQMSAYDLRGFKTITP